MASTGQSKYWCFTLNNYTQAQVNIIRDSIELEQFTYVCFGFEVGESGTPHLQGYLECKKRYRFNQIKRFLCIDELHLERRKGTAQQAKVYCQKDGTFEEYGEISKGQGYRSDLEALHEDLKNGMSIVDISNEHFSSFVKYQKGINGYLLFNLPERRWMPSNIVYYGPTGTGKTRAVVDNSTNLYIHPGGPWFDGYYGQPQVLFDDFGGSEFKLTYLLKLLDRYPMRVPVKGGFVQWVPREIYITSNQDPKFWFANAHPEHVRALFRRFSFVFRFQ